MGAGNQFPYASATPIGNVPKCHTGSMVGQKGLVNIALIRVLVADESRHTVETLCFILTEVEYERDQGRKDGAVAHVGEVITEAEEDLFHRIHACFVETVSGKRSKQEEL